MRMARPSGRFGGGIKIPLYLFRDEACEEFVVPSGDFSTEPERILAGGSSDQVEGHMFNSGEVGRGMIGADAAFVVAEIHVHDPVKAVLDQPVGSDRWPELGGEPQQ